VYDGGYIYLSPPSPQMLRPDFRDTHAVDASDVSSGLSQGHSEYSTVSMSSMLCNYDNDNVL
jgi:hypothetical protein